MLLLFFSTRRNRTVPEKKLSKRPGVLGGPLSRTGTTVQYTPNILELIHRLIRCFERKNIWSEKETVIKLVIFLHKCGTPGNENK